MSVLDEAQRAVHGPRNEDYGTPLDNHSATAEMVSAYLSRKYAVKVEFDAEDVCIFNVLQKVSRQAHCHKRDNLVDIAGYVANLEMVAEERARRSES